MTTALLGQMPKQLVETRRDRFSVPLARYFSADFNSRRISAPSGARFRHFLQTSIGLARRGRAMIGFVMVGI